MAATEPVVQPQSQLVTIKLTESNYLMWQQQILAAVTGYGLEDFLTGAKKAPPEYVTGTNAATQTLNPAYTTWKRQDQLLVSWLLSSLSESVLITAVGLKTSCEIWDALKTNFASQTQAKVMQYRLQLQTLRKGTMCMREYLSKIKGCCDVLAAAGEAISDKDQVIYILGGLSSDYNSVVVSVTSRHVPCTLMELHALLLSFETRLENTDNAPISVEGSPSINLTTHDPARRSGNNQWNRGRGAPFQYNNRGGRGMPRGGSFHGRGGRGNFTGPKCQICFRNNHTADKCFYRMDLSYVPNQQSINFTQGSSGYSQHHHTAPSQNFNGMNIGPSQNTPDQNASNKLEQYTIRI
ncbi:hypothetical protein DH2020_034849 [Rehmannia glutinosa]|uniref:Retrotransposon Copia-like N-terminal domain-containing protein n=1 Tax=Rehmannia glutinosa TaxID=99300 RepID=A0ABR0V8T1_REHGL